MISGRLWLTAKPAMLQRNRKKTRMTQSEDIGNQQVDRGGRTARRVHGFSHPVGRVTATTALSPPGRRSMILVIMSVPSGRPSAVRPAAAAFLPRLDRSCQVLHG